MNARQRLVVAGLLAVLGVGLLVAAYTLDEPERSSAAPATRDRATDASAVRPSTRARGGTLRHSSPRPATVPRGAPGAGEGPRAAPVGRGERLPPQWPAFEPTRLSLRPGVGGVSAPVDPVSVVGRTLQLPDDADRVGWWRGGSVVGAPFGTAVIAGHLDSATDPAGYLAGLGVLEAGDRVELSSSTERQSYRVVRNYLLRSADLSRRSSLFAQQRRHRLLLITCGGPYDHVRGRYRDNRVVVAVPTTS